MLVVCLLLICRDVTVRSCMHVRTYMYICLAAAVNYRPDEAFFTQYFQWRDDVPSRVHVIRKSDGQLLTTINTTAVFVTHQVSV